MPLLDFFVSLHHLSNRKIMFKKTDSNPLIDIFTAPSMQKGSCVSKKYSAPNAWHNQFYSLVTTKIDEEIFLEDIHLRSRLLCFTQNDHTDQSEFKICPFLKWAQYWTFAQTFVTKHQTLLSPLKSVSE